MNRIFLNKNITTLSILLFICLFSLIQFIKPDFLYNKDGTLRQFGLRKSRSTITPLWLITTALAILSYLFVIYMAK